MPPALAEETIAPDEASVTREFIAFLQQASSRRYPDGVMRRFNQGRHTACVHAELTVPEKLPGELRIGLFAQPRTYRARVRFANASSRSDRERDIRGMSIQVFDVRGDNLTPGAATQDFVLNSHPVMMAAGQKEFLALLQAVEAGGVRQAAYLLTHPRSAVIAFRAQQHPTSHLDITYWSATPYLFGPGRAVKYIARPAAAAASRLPDPLTSTYLYDAIKARLSHFDAVFDLMVQFQTDPRRTPIEDATVEWKERDSPYRMVARLRIPTQEVAEPEGDLSCERMSFNPWHCLADHRPLGDMNRARKEVYAAMSRFRSAPRASLTERAADRTRS